VERPSVEQPVSATGFYRIFYRTGRNGLVIHSTVQHGVSQITWSDRIRCTPANNLKPNR